MPKRTSDHGKHNRTPLLGGLKDSMNALAADLGLSKPKKHDTNPFGDALQETSERKGGIIDELTRHAVALSPVIKRRTFPELENVPEGLVLGWAQLPSTRGRGFSLGIFPDAIILRRWRSPIRMAAYSWAPTPTWTCRICRRDLCSARKRSDIAGR